MEIILHWETIWKHAKLLVKTYGTCYDNDKVWQTVSLKRMLLKVRIMKQCISSQQCLPFRFPLFSLGPIKFQIFSKYNIIFLAKHWFPNFCYNWCNSTWYNWSTFKVRQRNTNIQKNKIKFFCLFLIISFKTFQTIRKL